MDTSSTPAWITIGQSQLLGVIVGGAITAWVAVKAQQRASADALALQRSANAAQAQRDAELHRRLDQGVIRQTKALCRNLQEIVWVAAGQGLADPAKWEEAHRRLEDRIYSTEAAVALSDSESNAVHDVAFSSMVALTNVRRSDDQTTSKTGNERANAIEFGKIVTRGAGITVWDKLRVVWESFGDEVRINEWQAKNRGVER
jgi:hypothetical protein